MSTYAAPVEVCNAALADAGETQITSMLDGTPAAITLNTRYEPLVKKELAVRFWSWAKKVERLTLQGETGNSPRYAYNLPSDMLKPRYLKVGSSKVVGYEFGANKLLVDYQRDYDLHITWRVPESSWPPDFAEAMVKRLQAVILRALPVDYAQAKQLDAEANLLFMIAGAADRTAAGKQPETEIDPVLIRAWRGMPTNAQA